MGKSYHLIATGCKDGLIQIFKAYEQENGELKIETVARLNDHRQEVWRVEWNSTGTILSSAETTESALVEVHLHERVEVYERYQQ